MVSSWWKLPLLSLYFISSFLKPWSLENTILGHVTSLYLHQKSSVSPIAQVSLLPLDGHRWYVQCHPSNIRWRRAFRCIHRLFALAPYFRLGRSLIRNRSLSYKYRWSNVSLTGSLNLVFHLQPAPLWFRKPLPHTVNRNTKKTLI